MAKMIGLSKPTVIAAVKRLEDEYLVTVERDHLKANRYRLRWH